MKSPSIQFLWIGGRLSTLERLCLRSFLAHGHDVHLYTYEQVKGVPEGVRLLNGRDILPETAIFTYKEGFGQGSYAGFADFFRYQLLRKRGGWWFDMDCIALRSIPTPDDLLVGSSFEGKWGQCANNCPLYAPYPAHPAFEWLCTEAARIIATRTSRFGDIGPFLVQRLIREQSLERHVAPWWVFSPYPWRQVARTVQSDLRAILKDYLRLARFLYWQAMRPDFRAGYLRRSSLALHLHNEIWRSAEIDKDAAYHPWCIYERLKRRYHIASDSP
ncbi:glycosyltransferase [Geminisphaera colitermitum]|uniref:glycosyltransferase n=1 Tax=Geminisphaera colitermitum TaxID=1148786 RepID=UPI000158D268|nr:glycosyltransferase [Geminisphaera colitermitum]